MSSHIFHTTNETAQRLGIKPSRVRQLAAAMQVGRKVGRDWLFSDADIAVMQTRETVRGRKRKQ
jgi:hypothetical protein